MWIFVCRLCLMMILCFVVNVCFDFLYCMVNMGGVVGWFIGINCIGIVVDVGVGVFS